MPKKLWILIPSTAKHTVAWGKRNQQISNHLLMIYVISHAYFCLNKFNDAVDAYKKGLELDPENATLKNSLATATAKANASSVERSAEPSPASGLPNLGAGGMPDLGSLLNNPALMNMAQQMMQSGALEGLMNNPAVARMYVERKRKKVK